MKFPIDAEFSARLYYLSQHKIEKQFIFRKLIFDRVAY